MTEQEFLASFGVEIDESGVELLQQEPARNRGLRGSILRRTGLRLLVSKWGTGRLSRYDHASCG